MTTLYLGLPMLNLCFNLHWRKYKWPFLLSTESYFHVSASLSLCYYLHYQLRRQILRMNLFPY